MHTKHDGKEGVITMTVTGGLFIIGKLIGGNKLTDPRVFDVIEDGAKIQMRPLPGTPPFVTLGTDGFRYPVPEDDKPILDLYDRVTHPFIVTEPGKVLKMQ
jgi:hypothetical protein